MELVLLSSLTIIIIIIILLHNTNRLIYPNNGDVTYRLWRTN